MSFVSAFRHAFRKYRIKLVLPPLLLVLAFCWATFNQESKDVAYLRSMNSAVSTIDTAARCELVKTPAGLKLRFLLPDRIIIQYGKDIYQINALLQAMAQDPSRPAPFAIAGYEFYYQSKKVAEEITPTVDHATTTSLYQ